MPHCSSLITLTSDMPFVSLTCWVKRCALAAVTLSVAISLASSSSPPDHDHGGLRVGPLLQVTSPTELTPVRLYGPLELKWSAYFSHDDVNVVYQKHASMVSEHHERNRKADMDDGSGLGVGALDLVVVWETFGCTSETHEQTVVLNVPPQSAMGGAKSQAETAKKDLHADGSFTLSVESDSSANVTLSLFHAATNRTAKPLAVVTQELLLGQDVIVNSEFGNYVQWLSVTQAKKDKQEGILHLDEFESKIHRTAGMHSQLQRQVVEELRLENGDLPAVILDVGAHIGMFGMPLLAAGYHVVFVEPLAKNVAFLRASITDSNLARRATIIHGAAWNETLSTSNGLPLYAPAEHEDNSCLSQKGAVANYGMIAQFSSYQGPPKVTTHRVRAWALDDWFSKRPWLAERLAFIKIDVQGFELQVLQGLERTLSQPSLLTSGMPDSEPPSHARHHSRRFKSHACPSTQQPLVVMVESDASLTLEARESMLNGDVSTNAVDALLSELGFVKQTNGVEGVELEDKVGEGAGGEGDGGHDNIFARNCASGWLNGCRQSRSSESDTSSSASGSHSDSKSGSSSWGESGMMPDDTDDMGVCGSTEIWREYIALHADIVSGLAAPRFLISPRMGGMANGMIGLASALALAVTTRRALIFAWPEFDSPTSPYLPAEIDWRMHPVVEKAIEAGPGPIEWMQFVNQEKNISSVVSTLDFDDWLVEPERDLFDTADHTVTVNGVSYDARAVKGISCNNMIWEPLSRNMVNGGWIHHLWKDWGFAARTNDHANDGSDDGNSQDEGSHDGRRTGLGPGPEGFFGCAMRVLFQPSLAVQQAIEEAADVMMSSSNHAVGLQIRARQATASVLPEDVGEFLRCASSDAAQLLNGYVHSSSLNRDIDVPSPNQSSGGTKITTGSHEDLLARNSRIVLVISADSNVIRDDAVTRAKALGHPVVDWQGSLPHEANWMPWEGCRDPCAEDITFESVVDYELLGLCDAVIASYMSTFGVTAAHLVPLTEWEDPWINPTALRPVGQSGMPYMRRRAHFDIGRGYQVSGAPKSKCELVVCGGAIGSGSRPDSTGTFGKCFSGGNFGYLVDGQRRGHVLLRELVVLSGGDKTSNNTDIT